MITQRERKRERWNNHSVLVMFKRHIMKEERDREIERVIWIEGVNEREREGVCILVTYKDPF